MCLFCLNSVKVSMRLTVSSFFLAIYVVDEVLLGFEKQKLGVGACVPFVVALSGGILTGSLRFPSLGWADGYGLGGGFAYLKSMIYLVHFTSA